MTQTGQHVQGRSAFADKHEVLVGHFGEDHEIDMWGCVLDYRRKLLPATADILVVEKGTYTPLDAQFI